jgi:hypothetical protein
MERSNLKKLKGLVGKGQFHVEVSNRFAALEDLDTEVEINSAWETIRENIRISAKESLGVFILVGCILLRDVYITLTDIYLQSQLISVAIAGICLLELYRV